MANVIATLEDSAKVEMEPRLAGRRMTMILAPDKTKIARLKQSIAAAADNQQEVAADPIIPDEVANTVSVEEDTDNTT